MNFQTRCRAEIARAAGRTGFIALVFVLCHIAAVWSESLVIPASVSADGFCCSQPATNAIDSDLGTAWNSGLLPPASIILDLGQVFALSHIDLLTAQNPEGTTEHQISVSNDLASWTVANTLTGDTTDDQWLSATVNLAARYVKISTLAGPSWVAWREIRVFQQSGTLPSYGFWDQGFNNPKVRTNYDSWDEGTVADPLTILSCLFAGCPSFPTTYSASNAAAMNMASFLEPQYWVLLDNNEPSYDNRCNSGAPDTSLQHTSPGDGIFGFAPMMDTTAGESFYRAHLVLDSNFPNPCRGGIAYMSIGAHRNRGNVDSAGNSEMLGALNPTPGTPHAVSFVAKLYEYEPMEAALFRLVVVATWPDGQGRELPRMIQVNLFHDGDNDSSSSGPATLRWSWPFTEDTFFPGAEVVYFDAEDLPALCSGLSVERMTAANSNLDLVYDIDLQPLYQCAARWGGWSNGMPTQANLPITSVDWAVEAQGASGALWVAVDSMLMH